jgi:glucose dehydrogenase
MFLGTLKTRNWEWQTLANTTAEALENLRGAWESHAVDVTDPYSWESLEEEITLTPINLGDTLSTCHHCENLAHSVEAEEGHCSQLIQEGVFTYRSIWTGNLTANCETCDFKSEYWQCNCDLNHNCNEHQ